MSMTLLPCSIWFIKRYSFWHGSFSINCALHIRGGRILECDLRDEIDGVAAAFGITVKV